MPESPERPPEPATDCPLLSYPLLAAKLAPPSLPHNHIPRARLADRISRGTRFPLVVVTGVAGCGKTTLGSAWFRAGAAPGPSAWLSLDEEDNRPGVFWSYVLSAMCHLGVPPDRIVPPQNPDRVDRSVLVSAVTALRAAPEPVTLVLDRFDVLADREIGRMLDFVLQYATPALRLVILGRNARAFPLHRYRLSGEAVEIGNDDLAFTPDEAKRLLERHGLRLAQQDYRTMHSYTGGWVSALRLFASVARSANLPNSSWPGSTQHAVTDLLLSEVLETQSPLVQELLLRTSIVERIHPDLADRLTGRFDSETLLRDVASLNVFVEPLDTQPGWYRCQNLFRQALRTALDTRRPGLAPRLHAEAASWHAERGQLAHSVRHSAAIGDWNVAAARLVGGLRLDAVLAGPDAERLRTILSGMPEHTDSAPAAVVSAALALAQFDADRAAVQIDRARELSDTVAPDERTPFELSSALVMAMLRRYHGTGALAATAQAADDLWQQLPPERARACPDLRLLLLANLGAAQAWVGETAVARQLLQTVVTDAAGAEALVVRQDALGQLALLDLAEGNLTQAETHAREALSAAGRAGECSVLHTGAADAALAAIALERNALPDVTEHLNRALAATGVDLDPATILTVTLVRARMATGRGDGAGALEILNAGGRVLARRDGFGPAIVSFARARSLAHLSTGDYAGALRRLADLPEGADRTLLHAHIRMRAGEREEAQRLLDRAPADMSPCASIVWPLLVAELAASAGDDTTATEAVRLALARAKPGGYRRLFVESGAWLRRLLREHPELVGENPWLISRPSDGSRRASMRQPHLPVLEALTGRELEVLKCLAQAMSVRDIGAELYLSSNTVKTHLKSIYRKLGATGRSDAARRARKLELIP